MEIKLNNDLMRLIDGYDTIQNENSISFRFFNQHNKKVKKKFFEESEQ